MPWCTKLDIVGIAVWLVLFLVWLGLHLWHRWLDRRK
jgi:hypothetical protein